MNKKLNIPDNNQPEASVFSRRSMLAGVLSLAVTAIADPVMAKPKAEAEEFEPNSLSKMVRESIIQEIEKNPNYTSIDLFFDIRKANEAEIELDMKKIAQAFTDKIVKKIKENIDLSSIELDIKLAKHAGLKPDMKRINKAKALQNPSHDPLELPIWSL